MDAVPTYTKDDLTIYKKTRPSGMVVNYEVYPAHCNNGQAMQGPTTLYICKYLKARVMNSKVQTHSDIGEAVMSLTPI